MGSPLDFASSEKFRKDIIVKNLKPYNKSPYPSTQNQNYEYIQKVSDVKDSPDNLIDTPIFANQLYPLNQYGTEGGYKDVPYPGALQNKKSNEGEYGYQDANIVDQSLVESKKWKSINKFGDGSELVLDSAPFFSSVDSPFEPGKLPTNLNNNQPYPSTFVPSSYSPLSILLSPDPVGNNGLMSEDSYIVRLGAKKLKEEFQERIAAQIYQDTIGRANIFTVDSATDVLNILTGNVPLLQPNWTITIPENPILAATSFILRLGGSIIPVSPIPGSYFDTSATNRQPTTIEQLGNAFRDSFVGNLLTTLAGTDLTGSEIFYNNTGPGQKAQLFKNIDYNKYKPSFDRTLFNRLVGAVVGSTTDNSNYYVGSRTSDLSTAASPPGEVPVNEYGKKVSAPVYGPDVEAKLYEPLSEQLRLGSNAPAYIDGGGIEGGMTWVSPKYKGNAGKYVGLNGLIANENEDFSPSSYSSSESTNFEFREGSILYDTQKLIDSQPQGGKRLQHVGNAIDQVSKVFNDGYKELTKGSRVLSYVGAIGQEVGTEYCRVFAKDIPYLQYNDLQKTDGVVNQGRRFSYSVLDKTYNLNIAPNKQEGGQSSSNLINGPGGTSTNVAYAKKYMFSIENLAWRTSSTPGYTTSDLPICERGPNGGRVMWFPPYDLKFSETISPSFKSTTFLGRPEPIYTYENTTRSGTLNWSIVVDHPSVLNLIVNKVLQNETNKTRINGILTSFFAGCKKYDLYELAKKYYTVNPNDLFQLQQIITSKETTSEQMTYIKKTIQTGNNSPNGADQPVQSTQFDASRLKSALNYSFYFNNASPSASGGNYQSEFDDYATQSNITFFYEKNPQGGTTSFFNDVIINNFATLTGFTQELGKALSQTVGPITIGLKAASSAPDDVTYGEQLQKRRIDSVVSWFESQEVLKPYFKDSRILFNTESAFDVDLSVQPIVGGSFGDKTFCSTVRGGDQVVGGDTTGSQKIYTTSSMACRSVSINLIDTSNLSTNAATPEPEYQDVKAGKIVTETKKENVTEPKYVFKDNITKRVLRALLSECDYFETIKEETPMLFDNLKDKLKYFDPAFHSMTPEGLNSRLTFLQQCARPGDTIPTVKDINGVQTLQYNNATNTAFGTPPVLVLRIGDFFHTKIIPDSLSITYENLDLNPEGIGVQPMIAKVTMGFKFIGGQGLKSSVDKLQNALSFNYYANTEMWDDRADVTDDSYKVYDKKFLDDLNITSPPALNQSQPNNGQSNASTIGSILTSSVDQFETGTISYTEFMENLKTETQNYFQLIMSKQREAVQQYNNAVRQVWQAQRNYYIGRMNVSPTENETYIFGKPENVQSRFDSVFKSLIDDIDDDNDFFINFISQKTYNFNSKAIRQVSKNYTAYVNNKKGNFANAITKITQDLVTQQVQYVGWLGKVNTVTFRDDFGTDGYQQPNGNVVSYYLSGTSDVSANSESSNTLDELKTDNGKITEALKEFDLILKSELPYNFENKTRYNTLCLDLVEGGKQLDFNIEDVFQPFSDAELFEDTDNKNFRRQYMILSDDVTDDNKYATFKNAIIGNVIGNTNLLGTSNSNLEQVFDAYWINKAKPLFLQENAITLSLIESMEKNELKSFLNFTPYDSKERVMNFTTEPQDPIYEKEKNLLIKGLGGSAGQSGSKLRWNEEPEPNVLISKVKFN